MFQVKNNYIRCSAIMKFILIVIISFVDLISRPRERERKREKDRERNTSTNINLCLLRFCVFF